MKIYYATMNKKGYLAFTIAVIGLLLTFTKNTIILLIGLVLITILFDGVVNKDILLQDKNKLYLLSKRNSHLFEIINIIILFIAFALCISNLYFYGIILFYIIYLDLLIYNIVVTKKQRAFCGNIHQIEELLEKRKFDYFVYSIEKVESYDKKRYKFQLANKFDRNNIISVVYMISRYFINYQEVVQLINEKKDIRI